MNEKIEKESGYAVYALLPKKDERYRTMILKLGGTPPRGGARSFQGGHKQALVFFFIIINYYYLLLIIINNK